MTTKIQTALRLALEVKRFRNLADIEVHRTRRGQAGASVHSASAAGAEAF